MGQIWVYLKLLVLTVVMLGALWLVKLVWFRPFSIQHYFERVWWEQTLRSPMSLTELRRLEPYGIRWHNAQLNDISDEATSDEFDLLRKQLKTLNAYDTSAISEADKVSYEILDYALKTDLEREDFRYHDYPVNQLFGAHSYLIEFLTDYHQINDQTDAEHFLSRLGGVGTYMDQLVTNLQLREQRGIMPPKFVLERVQGQIGKFLVAKQEENVLYLKLQKDLKDLQKAGKLTDAVATELEQKGLEAMKAVVYPGYQKLLAHLKQQERHATTEDGVWKLPNGAAYYAYRLKVNTTTNYTPDQIHSIGLREVARIQVEMKRLLWQVGQRDTANLAKCMHNLAEDPRFLYPDTEEGRQQCLKDYAKIIDSINTGIRVAFHQVPKASVKVERVPAYKESSSPMGYYNGPATDGSRPGIFYTRLDIIREIPKWGMATLAYHEAVPGHHFQVALQQEMATLPSFRRYNNYNAYAEGWALYSERLAWEMGYIRNAYEDLGRLQDELFRAVRLVVDTGIHHKRWTRKQAIDYMVENTGMPESDITSEVERYIVLPGQACGYKLGMLKILELRSLMQEQLGDKFNLADFHAIVLNNGAMPLQVLEQLVRRNIERQKAV